jgi:RNA polymerase sigma factor (TIGR02999 family)
MDTSPSSFTSLLGEHRRGNSTALAQLLPLVYDELRHIAQLQLRDGRQHTLQPTALVHEAYLRLVDQSVAVQDDRRHFRGLCARLMRQILVDHARRRNALRRGGGRVAQLDTGGEPAAAGLGVLDLVALDEALERLAALDARKARIVELRLFCGYSMNEIADDIGTSLRTVEADWFFARAWLHSRLQPC